MTSANEASEESCHMSHKLAPEREWDEREGKRGRRKEEIVPALHDWSFHAKAGIIILPRKKRPDACTKKTNPKQQRADTECEKVAQRLQKQSNSIETPHDKQQHKQHKDAECTEAA